MTRLDDPFRTEDRASETVGGSLDLVSRDQLSPDSSNLIPDPLATLGNVDIESFEGDKIRTVSVADSQLKFRAADFDA